MGGICYRHEESEINGREDERDTKRRAVVFKTNEDLGARDETYVGRV